MMSGQKPNLWRVLSDSSRIISSNSVHFLTLSSLFIFPVSLLNIVYTLTVQPTPFHSHYGRRLLSTVSNQEYSDIPPVDKSQILFQILYGLLLLLFNISSVASITTSIFNGFHNKPLKLSSSLKSILSSFFPLLATKIAYAIIMGAIIFGFSFVMAFVFLGLVLLGFEIEPTSKSFMGGAFVILILFIVLFIYCEVKWFLMNVVVVVESTYGFASFERSSNLVKGKRGVALLMLLLFWVFNIILSAGYMSVARGAGSYCNGLLVVKMLAYGGASTISLLFLLAANTVFFIYCKAFDGEVTLPSYDKLGEVYVPLPRDVVDDV